jgi:hypothetical protein
MHRQVVLLLIVLGIGLVAFPLISTPTGPPDRLEHYATETPVDADPDEVEGITVYRYAELSPRGQQYFDAAVDAPRNDAYAVGVDEGASDFDYESQQGVLVFKGATAYQFRAIRVDPPASTDDILLRLGSLAAGVLLTTYGGYRWVNADG